MGIQPQNATLIKVADRGSSVWLLCCLVVNDLLEDLQKEGFLVYGYAAETAILVGGEFP